MVVSYEQKGERKGEGVWIASVLEVPAPGIRLNWKGVEFEPSGEMKFLEEFWSILRAHELLGDGK